MVIRPGRAPIRSSGGGVRTTLASILSKYSGSHHWDFGVSADKVAAGASMTPAQFLAAYPKHNLFQDSAGTTPAYLPTHPVGLCLDQPSGSVVLGAELYTTATAGIVALNANGTIYIASDTITATCTTNGTFGITCAAVTGSNLKSYRISIRTVSESVVSRKYIDFGGASGLDDATTGQAFSFVAPVNTPATPLRVYKLGATAGDTFAVQVTSVKEVLGSHASQSSTTKRPKLEARYNMLLATATLSTQSVTTLAASYKLTFTGSGTVTLSGTYVGSLVGGGSLTFTATAGTLTLTVTGLVTVADLRPANSPTNLPAYQRVTTSTDYDLTGFPLRAVWDGVDDCLVVPTLDLSITDKVTVVAGVTVQSTATLGFVYELSASYHDNTGAFAGYFGATESPTVVRRGGGSFGSTTGAAKTAPYPATLVVQHDLSGTTHLTETPVLLLNGATPALAEGGIADTGGGNFRSDALYIGQRGGYIFPFSGSVQSITLIPALITASETAVIEASVNNSMGKVF